MGLIAEVIRRENGKFQKKQPSSLEPYISSTEWNNAFVGLDEIWKQSVSEEWRAKFKKTDRFSKGRKQAFVWTGAMTIVSGIACCCCCFFTLIGMIIFLAARGASRLGGFIPMASIGLTIFCFGGLITVSLFFVGLYFNMPGFLFIGYNTFEYRSDATKEYLEKLNQRFKTAGVTFVLQYYKETISRPQILVSLLKDNIQDEENSNQIPPLFARGVPDAEGGAFQPYP